MKKHACSIAKHTAVFSITLFILWLLLFVSALIPNEAIRDRIGQSALSYKARNAFEFTNGKKLSAVADHYADSIWLNISWNMGEGNPLKSSFETQYYDGENLGENAGLYETVTKGTPPNTDYTRYWHGTAIFLRMFHLFTDVSGIKAIGFSVFLLLAAISCIILIRRKHWDLAIILILSLLAVQIWNIRLSLEYQPAWIIAFSLIPLFLISERKGNQRLTLLSVIGGTSVAFFDFLTTETVTLLLPLALIIAVRAKENRLGNFRQNLNLLLKCGISWALAYGGTFLIKWILASLMTDVGVFEIALASVAERIGSSVNLEKPNSIFSSVAANFSTLFGSETRVDVGRAVLGITGTLLVLLSVWYLFRSKERKPLAAFLLLALGFLVPLRYLLLNNHSFLHCFFTYRALVTPLFALTAAMVLHIQPPQKKGGRK